MNTRRMKKFFVLSMSTMMLLMTGAFAWGDVAINETNFPDEHFRFDVRDFDSDSDGTLSDEEIASVTEIDELSGNIASLKGIEYFTALTYLHCGNNQLTELDVSKNTALTELHCWYNQLTELDVSKNTALTYLDCGENQLIVLDVSNNVALTKLYCDTNQLTELDVSKNTALTYLYCDENQLTELDVSNNTALTELGCGGDQLMKLNVSNNTALSILYCGGEQLTELNVNNNTALTILNCGNSELTALDVSNNTALTTLDCRNNELTALDVSNNTALTYLHCGGNNMTTLDVSNNTALTSLSCSNNRLTISTASLDATGDSTYPYSLNLSLLARDVDVQEFASRMSVTSVKDTSDNDVAYSVNATAGIVSFGAIPSTMAYDYDTKYVNGTENMGVKVTFTGDAPDPTPPTPPTPATNIAINATNFPDANFRSYVSSNLDDNADDTLSESEIISVTAIDVTENNISSLKGIEFFTELKILNCPSNDITELDVSSNTLLTELWAMSNDITVLDISTCTALKKIGLHSNNLSSLNVSHCTGLEELHCGDNPQLSSITLGSKPSLTQLYCYRDNLSALHVSGCPALQELHFGGNKIRNIDVRNCTALTYLHLWGNELTSLDVSSNTVLTDLNCNGNNLSELDLSNCPNITDISCNLQTIELENPEKTEDTYYPYRVKFSDLGIISEGSDFISHVSNLSAHDYNGNSLTVTLVNHEAWQFSGKPKTIKYNYDVQKSGTTTYMDVTVTFTGPNSDDDDDIPSAVMTGVLSAFPGLSASDIHYFSDSELSYEWEMSENDISSITGRGEQIVLKLPRMMPASTGVYVLKCDLSGAAYGSKLKLYGITDGNRGNVIPSAVDESLEYTFLDANGNEIDTVPEDKIVYVALKLNAGSNTGGVITVPSELKTGTIKPVGPEELTENVLEKIADSMSLDVSDIQFISEDNITPPQEPTEAMKQEASNKDMEFVGKMNTLTVQKRGHYIVKVTLSNELYEQLKNVSVKDIRAYALHERDNGTQDASVRAAVPIVYGFFNTWEIFSLTGKELTDNLTQTFLMIGLLEAGEPFTLYLLKTLLMLLAGCDAGFGLGGISVLAVGMIAFMAFRKSKKH